MLFENTTSERIKFCLGFRHGYDFVTIRPGERGEVPDSEINRALKHGLVEYKPKPVKTKAVKSSIGKRKVETKQKELED